MSKKVNWILTEQNVTVNYDGQTHIVPRSDELAAQLIEAIKSGKKEEIPSLVSKAQRIEKFSNGTFVVKNGDILVNGIVVPAELSKKILSFSNEGLPYQPLVKFAENLLKNPSFRAVNELFQFLEKNDHPITDEGNFIAYKRVRGDFTDIHSGTFDNSVGKTVEMARNQVNEDPNQTCSHGLHVANWDYAHNHFASHNPSTDIMLEVEVNPGDVVAVPTDYNQSKMRVCAYKVLSVVDKEHSSETRIRYTSDVNSDSAFSDSEDSEECNDVYYCESCGDETDSDYDVCSSCEIKESEEENLCVDCDDVCDKSSERCDNCKEEFEKWARDRLSLDDDDYPWEDELK